MKERATLEVLLARVLEGEGPDRELDAEIDLYLLDAGIRAERFSIPFDAPPYTASLDAALTLVPEGWLYELHSGNDEDWAEVTLFPYLAKATFWTRAATPPRALIAACLKARMEGLGE